MELKKFHNYQKLVDELQQYKGIGLDSDIDTILNKIKAVVDKSNLEVIKNGIELNDEIKEYIDMLFAEKEIVDRNFNDCYTHRAASRMTLSEDKFTLELDGNYIDGDHPKISREWAETDDDMYWTASYTHNLSHPVKTKEDLDDEMYKEIWGVILNVPIENFDINFPYPDRIKYLIKEWRKEIGTNIRWL